MAAAGEWSCAEAAAEELDLAGVGRQEPADDLHQRALARAVAAHQRDDLGGAHLEVDLLHGARGAERLVDARAARRRASCASGSAAGASSTGAAPGRLQHRRLPPVSQAASRSG